MSYICFQGVLLVIYLTYMRITNQPVAPPKKKVTVEKAINSEDQTVVQQISTACSERAETSLNNFGPPTKTCLQQPADNSIK